MDSRHHHALPDEEAENYSPYKLANTLGYGLLSSISGSVPVSMPGSIPGSGPGFGISNPADARSAAVGTRTALRDLTPNSPAVSGRGVAGIPGNAKGELQPSPLKRDLKRNGGDLLNEERGLTYLKRRRGHEELGRRGQREAGYTPLFKNDNHTTLSRPANRSAPSNQHPAQFKPLSPPSSARTATHHEDAPLSTSTRTPAQERSSTGAKDSSDSDESGPKSQNSNNTRTSFSSLINYDPASQQTLASQALDALHPRHERHLSDTVRARAEALKMRLKVAIYKVQTNQIDVPFGRLRVPAPAPPAVHPSNNMSDSQQGPQYDTRHDSRHEMTSQEEEEDDYDDGAYGLGIGMWKDNTTPNLFSTPFITPSQRVHRVQRVPSSSPPFIHMPSSSLPRHAVVRHAEDEPRVRSMGRLGRDHESLDSETTELAEDCVHSGIEVGESPTGARLGMGRR